MKLLLPLSDLSRRWTLAEIGAEMGASPVYLTQLFGQVEGVPLYRYHLRLRLARALDLVPHHEDLATLALDLGRKLRVTLHFILGGPAGMTGELLRGFSGPSVTKDF